METRGSHDDDEDTSEHEESDTEDEISITTENSSKEEIDARTKLIKTQHPRFGNSAMIHILQALRMEGHDESKATQNSKAFAQILPVLQKELADV